MSRRTLAAMNTSRIVETVTTTARPTTALHGVSVEGWSENGGFSPPLAAVFLSADEAQTLDAPTGGTAGPEIWCYHPSLGWNRTGYLNDGQPIEIAGNGQGYAQELNVMGIFTRIAIAATRTAGTHPTTAKLAPIDHWTGP